MWQLCLRATSPVCGCGRQLLRCGACRFEAAWKDPECDLIYEHLRREMEIDRRYEALEDKVSVWPTALSWSIKGA